MIIAQGMQEGHPPDHPNRGKKVFVRLGGPYVFNWSSRFHVAKEPEKVLFSRSVYGSFRFLNKRRVPKMPV